MTTPYHDLIKYVEERYGDMTYAVVEYLEEGNTKRELAMLYMESIMASDGGADLLIEEVKSQTYEE